MFPKDSQRASGTIMIAMTIVAVVTIVVSSALLSLSRTNARVLYRHVTDTSCGYVAIAAVNHAFAEIGSQLDSTGHGLGAMGMTTPIAFLDSQGKKIAEYKTVVVQEGDTNIIVAVAASPSFADAETMESLEAVVLSDLSFLLRPKPGAISISGPVVGPDFPGISDNLHVDGGKYPAITVSNRISYDEFMDELGDNIASGDIDGTELQGDLTTTYEHDDAGEITLPVWYQDFTALSAEAMNDYRNQLRSAVLSFATSADRVVSSTVYGDQVWGTAGAPEVTVIEAGEIGKDSVFGTDGQTITGSGTLIIKHTIRPGFGGGDNLNFNWDGNVFVLGFDGDGSDLMYLKGTQGTINGNLVLLSSDHTEASLELRDSDRPSDLTINGGLLALAEANSHESEVEVEGSSSITVNGLMGLYGSRIEIESSTSNTSITVDGTLAIGMAQDLEEIDRGDDFELEMYGSVNVTYDKDNVDSAVAGLADMQMKLGMGDDQATAYDVKLTGGMTGVTKAVDTLAQIDAIVAEEGIENLGFESPYP